jgi:hypothetical protein
MFYNGINWKIICNNNHENIGDYTMVQYRTLEDRMLHAILDTMAQEFIPCKCEVAEESQRQFYEFIKSVYTTLADDPLIMFKETQEDDSHPNRFNKASYGKQKLKPAMRKIIKEMDDLMTVLYALGTEGTLTADGLYIGDTVIKKKYISIIEKLGLILDGKLLKSSIYPQMFDAWKMMSTPKLLSQLYRFTHCYFNPASHYTSKIFGRLLGDEKTFNDLEQWLRSEGFIRIDCVFDKEYLSLNYVKCIGDPNAVIGNSSYDKNFIGVSVCYDPFVDKPVAISVRLPRHKEIVDHFDDMSNDLKRFFIKWNLKCNNCDYCIQRFKNKVNQPPRAYKMTKYNGTTYKLCPIFPCYYYIWTEINTDLSEGIKELTAFVSELFKAEITEFKTGQIIEDKDKYYI